MSATSSSEPLNPGQRPAAPHGSAIQVRPAVVPGSGQMFNAIAHRYDLLNRLMSLGLDTRWRVLSLRALQLKPGAEVLDLATGTADMALLLKKLEPSVRITGLDPSVGMLEVGRKKVEAAGLSASIALLEGDAQDMPFPDQRFDGACMAFGIRNVPDRARALRELARVVRPGGRIALLELSEPPAGLVGLPARLYVHHVVPRLGAWLSGAQEYRYLQQSIAAFPPPPRFAEQLREAGLEVLEVRPFLFGVCQLFLAASRGVQGGQP